MTTPPATARLPLYFSPLACSLAARIVVDEAQLADRIEPVEVDPKQKRVLADGRDYRTIHALGLVPALDLGAERGGLLVENAAILQYLATLSPAGAALVPAADDALGRARLQQWLSFIGTELHKLVFVPVLNRDNPPAVRELALAKAPARLAYVAAHLADRAWLLGEQFTVADAYLLTVLNWTQVTPIDLARDYPALAAYLARGKQRPSVARALAIETPLYVQELARAKAAS